MVKHIVEVGIIGWTYFSFIHCSYLGIMIFFLPFLPYSYTMTRTATSSWTRSTLTPSMRIASTIPAPNYLRQAALSLQAYGAIMLDSGNNPKFLTRTPTPVLPLFFRFLPANTCSFSYCLSCFFFL